MTMTTPACPMGAVITDSVCEAVGALAPDSEQVEVELVWDPPWHPGLMSDGARTVFGW
jgi:metal-sulfur cluster biosynthetic enzyme